MKLSPSEVSALYVALAPVVASFKATTTPPARDGTTKKVDAAFAAACWTRRYVDALVYVIEKESNQANDDVSARGGASASPFPS